MSKSGADIDLFIISIERYPLPVGLDAAEVERAASISNPLMRRHYEATRAAVRAILGARLGVAPGDVRLERGSAQKPRVLNVPGCEFSISHSGDFLAVAVADFPVGVDIETRRPQQSVLRLARRFFSTTDFERIERADPAARETEFLRQWVAKEAALKATGRGLAGGLAEATCEFAADGIVAVQGVDGRIPVRGFELADGTPGAVGWLGRSEAKIRRMNAEKFAT